MAKDLHDNGLEHSIKMQNTTKQVSEMNGIYQEQLYPNFSTILDNKTCVMKSVKLRKFSKKYYTNYRRHYNKH